MTEKVFSDGEIKVYEIIGSRSMTITDIASEFFGPKKTMNRNAKIRSYILRINMKCEYHKLAWFINGAGIGRQGRTVWKDKR